MQYFFKLFHDIKNAPEGNMYKQLGDKLRSYSKSRCLLHRDSTVNQTCVKTANSLERRQATLKF
jgi:hypothetical protein